MWFLAETHFKVSWTPPVTSHSCSPAQFGQECITFIVEPKRNLTTNTEIRNKATIFFDGVPLDTPEWLNRIDASPPTSRMVPLAPAQSATSFPVRWSGIDEGAGVGTYDVFVSDNNAPFTAWQTQTSATQAMFTGVNGHTYRLYSIAHDFVGNSEGAKTVAEATTRVEVGSAVPGDVNSDGVVNCADIAIVRAAFGKRTGQAGFDPRADVVADGIIDVRDLAYVSQRLPVGTVCN
jgi:hypothetical protein